MQLRIDNRTFLICNSDRLVCLRRLACVTPASVKHLWRTLTLSPPVRGYTVTSGSLEHLFQLTDYDRSCTQFGTFSDAHWQGCRHLRQGPILIHPSAFGRCSTVVAVGSAECLSQLLSSVKTRTPRFRTHVESRHNFGSGYSYPIWKCCLHQAFR